MQPEGHTLNSKALTDLVKLYNDDNKFNSELYNILDAKLKIFKDLCKKANIS